MPMKWLLTLTVSVMLLAGCATLGFKDEPAPDVPAFVEGQAKALVIESVSDMNELSAQANANTQIIDWRDRLLLACITSSYSFTYEREFLKESYDGDGVWTVWIDTTSNGASPLIREIMETWKPPESDVISYMDFKWRVYESTGTVLSKGKTFTIDGELESRPYC